tara:strand:+ start:296 stop:661 length:366 start_codon:yes stop_codon:yes gene_type:complete
MNYTLSEYLPILIFLLVALIISSLFVLANYLVAVNNPDPEKNSAYECGFEQFGDSRMKFDVRFYLVTLLFIIFDLEVAFLFPWAVTFGTLGLFGYVSMMVFLGVLTIGFIYEWKKGALEWQ